MAPPASHTLPDSDKPLLIFDFDGTLAQTLETGIAIYNEIAPDWGLRTVTMEEAQELRKLHTRALLDRLGVSRLMAVKLAAHIRRLLHERMDQVKLIPNVSDAIRQLREEGFRMGILSSNSAENVRMFLQRYHLDECFSFIEAGVSLFGKPHRIRNVLKQVKVPAAETMYVGDETRDMEASRKAGVCGLAVCWGANGREAMLTEGPEFCVDTPSEMVAAARHFASHGPPVH
ncbi:MAG: HAD-IA family hydrolase [Verrucomicrobiae bacterium]|nr:HAD-IA family hydrolase [Verrucomicrobiae bacterium]